MRNTKPNITIHMGASKSTVTVDGHVFDRRKMSKEENSKLRRIVRDCFSSLQRAGTWGKQAKFTARAA
jgi:hypothetical protein